MKKSIRKTFNNLSFVYVQIDLTLKSKIKTLLYEKERIENALLYYKKLKINSLNFYLMPLSV